MRELASGIYRYWRDGELQDIVEPWSLHARSDGLQLRGLRRIGDAASLQVEADYTDGHCTAVSLNWQSAAATLAARYRRAGDLLQWTHNAASDVTSTQTRPLPTACLLFPLLRAAAGPIVQQLAEGPRWLVLPCLRDPDDRALFLTPLLSQRRATDLGESGALRHYRYYGGEYGDRGADYWLNRHGLLQQYRWTSAQGDWQVRLDRYSSHADFRGLR